VIGINKIKVLIVDDSALVRKLMTKNIEKESKMEVVGTAVDPYDARDKILALKPDVILLDIEMPKMDGLTFLRKLMKSYPCRVIIVSSLAEKKSKAALTAIENGALGVIAKPGSSYAVPEMMDDLMEKIRQVAAVPDYKLKSLQDKINGNNATKPLIDAKRVGQSNKIIAMGASTGGTNALKEILERLPKNMPPIVIVQHMPQYFTKSFAERLDSLCELKVKEAEDREVLTNGKVLIAPGNIHMEIKRTGGMYFVKLVDSPRVYHQKPAVDILFKSVAKYVGKDAVGVILTGMGRDGANGMLEMKKAGAYNIAQDEKSCVVFGMPKEAIELGGVDKVAHLDNIPAEIIKSI